MSFQPHEQDIDWELEERHLDEAEFYFQAWQDAHDAPNYTLAEIAAGPERRLLGHIDALQIGGPVVFQRLLAPAIEDDDADHERIAAAVLGGSQTTHAVGVLAASAAPEQQLGIIRALQSIADPNLDATLISALASARGTSIAPLLELLALRRVPVDASLRQYLCSDEPTIVRAAAKLARYCSEPSILADVAALARADDAELRCAVVETALLRNLPGAWESALYWAFDPASDIRRAALTWVASLGDAAVHARLLKMLDERELRQDLLWVAGFTGRVSAVDRCIERLDDEHLGPLAAEAIAAIAGLPIEDPPFAKPPAQPRDDADQSLPELHRDLATNLVGTPESALVHPEPEPISRWWQANRGRFDPTRRYLGGEPLTSRVLVDALWHAPARRRHLLAHELELRTGGAAAVDTHQFHRVQARQLEHLPELDHVDFQRGFPLR